jgi:signal transduction histidine kinase
LLIARARAMVEKRRAPRPTDEELSEGIPLFLDQLAEVLRLQTKGTAAMAASATQHGADLLKMGFTIAQVVHDYGDVCQSVTELAVEKGAPIDTDEFRILNKCLDDAIAGSVTEFARLRERTQTDAETERLGVLTHELRNKLSATTLAFETLRTGRVGIGGSTGALIDRSLRGMRDLIDRSLAEVRIDAGRPIRERIPVRELLEEIEVDASLEARARGIALSVTPVAADIAIEGDRPILIAALINLVHNAIKFTKPDGAVSLDTKASRDCVTFAIQDQCGGLPPGKTEDLFAPYTQESTNREGVGLGLSIARRGVEASQGTIAVQDLPGQGCIFRVELPRVHG